LIFIYLFYMLSPTCAQSLFETDVFTLGSYYTKVKGLLEISTKDVDPVCLLEKYSQDLGGFGDESRVILDGAGKILSLAHDEALLSGKSPEHIARAALCLMVEVKEKTPFHKTVVAHRKTKYEASTIRDRYFELKTMMVKLATQVHYLTGVTEKNVAHYIPEILDFFWVLKARQTFSVVPGMEGPDDDEGDGDEELFGLPSVHSLFSPITVATPHTPHPEYPSRRRRRGSGGEEEEDEEDEEEEEEEEEEEGKEEKVKGIKDEGNGGGSLGGVDAATVVFKRKSSPPLSKREERQRRLRALPIGPSAYNRNLLRQQDWAAKVEKAERHLKAIVDEGGGGGQLEFGSLGEDELAIQRLLLAGKSGSELSSGTPLTLHEIEESYQAMIKEKIEAAGGEEERELRKRKLDAVEVGRDDMSDDEMREYLKTEEEVEGRKKWDALVEEHSAKSRKTQ